MTKKNAIVILPTYNESENLPKIVPAILKQEVDIVIVDDDSPDGTGKLADDFARKNKQVNVIHRKEKGRASAGIAGFKFALEKGYDYILEMDADFSHDPTDIPKLLKVMGEADVAIGSRYVTGGKFIDCKPINIFISHLANAVNTFVLGLNVMDSSGGFKCYKHEVLKAIDLDSLRSKGYSIGVETLYKCARHGFRLKEIPIDFKDRLRGNSKLNLGIRIEYPLVVLRLRLGNLINKNVS